MYNHCACSLMRMILIDSTMDRWRQFDLAGMLTIHLGEVVWRFAEINGNRGVAMCIFYTVGVVDESVLLVVVRLSFELLP